MLVPALLCCIVLNSRPTLSLTSGSAVQLYRSNAARTTALTARPVDASINEEYRRRSPGLHNNFFDKPTVDFKQPYGSTGRAPDDDAPLQDSAEGYGSESPTPIAESLPPNVDDLQGKFGYIPPRSDSLMPFGNKRADFLKPYRKNGIGDPGGAPWTASDNRNVQNSARSEVSVADLKERLGVSAELAAKMLRRPYGEWSARSGDLQVSVADLQDRLGVSGELAASLLRKYDRGGFRGDMRGRWPRGNFDAPPMYDEPMVKLSRTLGKFAPPPGDSPPPNPRVTRVPRGSFDGPLDDYGLPMYDNRRQRGPPGPPRGEFDPPFYSNRRQRGPPGPPLDDYGMPMYNNRRQRGPPGLRDDYGPPMYDNRRQRGPPGPRGDYGPPMYDNRRQRGPPRGDYGPPMYDNNGRQRRSPGRPHDQKLNNLNRPASDFMTPYGTRRPDPRGALQGGPPPQGGRTPWNAASDPRQGGRDSVSVADIQRILGVSAELAASMLPSYLRNPQPMRSAGSGRTRRTSTANIGQNFDEVPGSRSSSVSNFGAPMSDNNTPPGPPSASNVQRPSPPPSPGFVKNFVADNEQQRRSPGCVGNFDGTTSDFKKPYGTMPLQADANGTEVVVFELGTPPVGDDGEGKLVGSDVGVFDGTTDERVPLATTRALAWISDSDDAASPGFVGNFNNVSAADFKRPFDPPRQEYSRDEANRHMKEDTAPVAVQVKTESSRDETNRHMSMRENTGTVALQGQTLDVLKEVTETVAVQVKALDDSHLKEDTDTVAAQVKELDHLLDDLKEDTETVAAQMKALDERPLTNEDTEYAAAVASQVKALDARMARIEELLHKKLQDQD